MERKTIDTIYDIFQAIRDYEKIHGEKFRLYENSWQKIPFLIAVLSFVGAVVLAFIHAWVLNIPNAKAIAYLLLFIGLICIVIYEIFVFAPVITVIFRPTDSYLKRLQKSVETEKKLIDQLAEVDVAVLSQAIERLEHEVISVENRISSVTGLLQKLGIIPAAVALYIAYSKHEIGQSSFLLKYIDYVLYFLFGTYLGVLMANNIIDRLKLFSISVKAAKDRAELRGTLRSPHKPRQSILDGSVTDGRR